MELRDKHVLITGASRGIGRKLADELAARGACVTLVARTEAALREAAEAVGGSYVVTDLADAAARSRLLEQAGPVDVLVNNAGLDVSGPFRDTSTDNLRRLIEVNVVAPAELTRQALDGMLERRFGRIVFMSSLSAEVALPGLVAYSATKAAISQLADGLRDELAGSGIGITLVEIGGAVTEMYETARSYKPTADGFDRAYKLGMLRELGADEVARAIAKAIERDRPSVVLPRRGRTQYAMARAPQAIARLVGIVR